MGGCIRAIGEWSAASRAIGRLDIGEVEYFSDVLSTDHLHVDPVGVEGAVITASCVDYSSAGAQAGLNGTRGWQVVDAPRTLLHFRDLLVTLVENVWGFTEANDGKSFAFYRTAMQRLHHKVYDPQRINSRHLGMAIQSERAFVFTNRIELDGHLGEPRRLDMIRLPRVPMRRKLLPIAEVLRRRSECEIALVPGSFRACTVTSRDFGPVRIGTAEFSSRKGDGTLRVGARIKLHDSNQLWRVLSVTPDGRLRLRCGKNVKYERPKVEPEVKPFSVDVYSLDGQAFRVTASSVAEPPLYQSKACYLETRCNPSFFRILLAGDGYSLMEKQSGLLKVWKTRAAEEASDSLLPKTVPPFTESILWELTGNSIAQRMAALGVGELHTRWRAAKGLLASGAVSLTGQPPESPDDLYDEATLKWRRVTRAGEKYSSQAPQSYGIDDSHLNVSSAAKRLEERGASSLSAAGCEEALGHLRELAQRSGERSFPPTQEEGAENDEFVCGGLYSGSEVTEPLGAERRISTRARAEPLRLQMPPTMRGGARTWQERMPSEEPDLEEVTTKASEKAAGRRSAGVAAAGVASRAKPAKAKGATVKEPFGPERPPARGRVVSHHKARKTQRNRGLAIAALEGADLFRKGDWQNIEKFATMKLPMYSVAWSTLKGYESCWKHWISFQYYARLDIFVEVSTPAQRRRSAGWLLCFVALLAYGCGYKASTIKKCLMAVRFFHLAHEYDNPIERLPRVWQAYRAVKRHQGPTVRKHPITPEMCLWLDEEQRGAGLPGVIKRASRYFAIYLGCRCSEYLGPEIHWEKICLVSCIRPMMGDEYCTWFDDFDGLMVTFRASKTDQYNEGCKRYLGHTDNSMCAVKAFREWVKLQPGWFRNASSNDRPMFSLPDGRVLGRSEVQLDYRAAAAALGLPTENIGTHSCRVSCATWLYQAGYDIEYIKRHARWAGNSVHVYLWEGSGHHDMVKKMSEVKFKLHLHVF